MEFPPTLCFEIDAAFRYATEQAQTVILVCPSEGAGCDAARVAFAGALPPDAAVGGTRAKLEGGGTVRLCMAEEISEAPEEFTAAFVGWGMGEPSRRDRGLCRTWRDRASLVLHNEDAYR